MKYRPNIRPTISATIIAKNEEEVIGRCLRSLEGIDEIIVHDTGSTDKTREIAEKLGARVIAGKPIVPFHFSEARNEAMRHAKNDWILTIDCDEVLAPGSLSAMRDAIMTYPQCLGFLLTLIMRAEEGQRSVRMDRLALHRKGKWDWKYRVHNQLQCRTQPVNVARVPLAIIDHLTPIGRRKVRNEQSFELLKIAAQESPEHTRLFRHLAHAYTERGEHEKAVEAARRYVKETPERGLELSEGYCILARALDRCKGRGEDALAIWNRAHVIAPERREPLFQAARALIWRKEYAKAAEWLEKLLSVPSSQKPRYHLNWEAAWDDTPQKLLSFCRENLEGEDHVLDAEKDAEKA